jgi:hypothetical protein
MLLRSVAIVHHVEGEREAGAFEEESVVFYLLVFCFAGQSRSHRYLQKCLPGRAS